MGRAEHRRALSRAIMASLCIWAALTAFNLLREQQFPAEQTSTGQHEDQSLPGRPWDLIKFGDFLGQVGGQMTPLELSHRLLLYTEDLLSVGQHNLAALFGLETYLVQQLWAPNSTSGAAYLSAPQVDIAASAHLESPVRAGGLMKMFKSSPKAGQTIETSGEIEMFNDHRRCFNEIRNQGSCGSCYAFSLLSLVEWHYCKQFNQLIDFSEQFIIDCGRASKLGGCTEGQPSKAKDFCVHYGLKLEKDWPYRGDDKRKLVCSVDELKRNEIVMSSKSWWPIEVDRQMFEQTLKYQPILINLNSPKKFHKYKSGIHSGQDCDVNQPHGAVIVGDGVADGEEFWLIRNSYGSDWGENGYLRLSKKVDMNKCFDDAFVGKFMFHFEEEPFERFYQTFEFYPLRKKIASKSGLSRDLLRL